MKPELNHIIIILLLLLKRICCRTALQCHCVIECIRHSWTPKAKFCCL